MTYMCDVAYFDDSSNYYKTNKQTNKQTKLELVQTNNYLVALKTLMNASKRTVDVLRTATILLEVIIVRAEQATSRKTMQKYAQVRL
jgi:hypothetical protein